MRSRIERTISVQYRCQSRMAGCTLPLTQSRLEGRVYSFQLTRADNRALAAEAVPRFCIGRAEAVSVQQRMTDIDTLRRN